MRTETKKWTVMVYMAGDNNLDGAGITDLNEMKQTGSADELNVLAQFDRAGTNVSTNRYCLRHGTSLAADVVTSLGETNMGDPAVLQSFLEWGIANYPADRYLIVLWNHGNGWDDEDIYRAARSTGFNVMRRDAVVQKAEGRARGKVLTDHVRAVSDRFGRSMFASTVQAAVEDRGIAYDDEARDFLDNGELKKVFSAIKTTLGRPVDVLGMDACLMNMLEVAYQVRQSVAFVVGSEQTEPNAGWPYNTILASLAANPNMTPKAVSALVVTKYIASYTASSGVTQSALDQSKVVAVRKAVEVLGHLLRLGLGNSSTRPAILEARHSVQHYYKPEYVDLVDFCEKLMAQSIPAKAKAILGAMITNLMPFIVKNGKKGASVAGSNGVSIYFPTNGVSPLYATLDFAKASEWAKFIAAYQA
jgi:hypothetical protein